MITEMGLFENGSIEIHGGKGMASFEYDGNYYYNVNGKWIDANSRPVRPDIAKALDEKYTGETVHRKQEAQKKQQNARRRYDTYNPRLFTKGKSTALREARVQNVKQSKLNHEQEKALELLESGRNIFLSGEAGTGKSYVINEYIRKYRDTKKIIVCAPTGIAAIAVGGATIHRVFGAPLGVCRPGDCNKSPDGALIESDVIIIDEISMCRFDLFEYVIRTIRRAEELSEENDNRTDRRKQIIVVGDFYQLPPVLTKQDREQMSLFWKNIPDEGFAFQSSLWKEEDFTCVLLHEIVRQKGDEIFVKNLNKIRIGDVEGLSWFNENVDRAPLSDGIYLCGKNADASELNDERIAALPGEGKSFQAVISGSVEKSDKMTEDTLLLKNGMQVMTLINNDSEGYQNGSIGKIISINEGSIDVRLGNGKQVNVSPYEWEITDYEIKDGKLVQVVVGTFKQLPIKPAYAITIHKAQGQTYSCANVIPDCFAVGQLYVALSRVTSASKMSLAHEIRSSSLKVSLSVKRFYDDIERNS